VLAAAVSFEEEDVSLMLVGCAVFVFALWLGRWMLVAPESYLEAQRSRAVLFRSLAERMNQPTRVNVLVVRATGALVIGAGTVALVIAVASTR
jgi:hypothetical protein